MAESISSFISPSSEVFKPSTSSGTTSSSSSAVCSPLKAASRHNRQYRNAKEGKMQTEAESDAVSGLGSPHQTVLRLKRRVEDSPSQVLLMSYSKRRKNENGGYDTEDVSGEEGETCTSVFRFAGTISQEKSESNAVEEVIRKALKEVDTVNTASKDSVKRRDVKIAAKTKEAVKKSSSSNRFKVVSNKRGIDEFDHNSPENLGSEDFSFNMLDLVADCSENTRKKEHVKATPEPGTICVNGLPMVKESQHLKTVSDPEVITKSSKESGFVFDLYVTSNAIPTNHICDKYVSVTYEDDWDSARVQYDDELDGDAQIPDDEEDSNDEDNWRNDYPDTDPGSEDEDGSYHGHRHRSYGDGVDDDAYLIDRFGDFKIRGEEELSSDEDEIYSMENHGEDDIAGEGAMLGQYKQYKARIAKEMDMVDEVVSSPCQSDVE